MAHDEQIVGVGAYLEGTQRWLAWGPQRRAVDSGDSSLPPVAAQLGALLVRESARSAAAPSVVPTGSAWRVGGALPIAFVRLVLARGRCAGGSVLSIMRSMA